MIYREIYRKICLEHIKDAKDKIFEKDNNLDNKVFLQDIFECILWLLQDVNYRLNKIEDRLDALDS